MKQTNLCINESYEKEFLDFEKSRTYEEEFSLKEERARNWEQDYLVNLSMEVF